MTFSNNINKTKTSKLHIIGPLRMDFSCRFPPQRASNTYRRFIKITSILLTGRPLAKCPCIFSCDQAALTTLQSVRLSVCPSVRLWHLFHKVSVIVSSWNFQELLPLTKVMPCKRSRSKAKVTEVKTQLSRFRTVTPDWIHLWWWNDAKSLMLPRRGALLFFKVFRHISRSRG